MVDLTSRAIARSPRGGPASTDRTHVRRAVGDEALAPREQRVLRPALGEEMRDAAPPTARRRAHERPPTRDVARMRWRRRRRQRLRRRRRSMAAFYLPSILGPQMTSKRRTAAPTAASAMRESSSAPPAAGARGVYCTAGLELIPRWSADRLASKCTRVAPRDCSLETRRSAAPLGTSSCRRHEYCQGGSR